MNNLLRWWSEVKTIRTLVECARYEGNPLFKLCKEMSSWGISFSEYDIAELEKYLLVLGPFEAMFSALNTDTQTSIQKVFPSIMVIYISLFFVMYLS